MSFILDALKKSESERQQQTGADFSSVPSSSGEPQSFKWLWFLALLLLINIVVLIGILMRPDQAPDDLALVEEAPPEQAQITAPTFEEKITEAKQIQQQPATAAMPDPEPQALQAAAKPEVAPRGGRVLTIDEVRLNGSLQLTGDLHLDIHVYSDVPAERFVFINMTKHREQSELDEGPVVTEITADGVILEYQGTTFLLPRE
jgi:general secretion pathway protein B